jgi:hypothetical protein
MKWVERWFLKRLLARQVRQSRTHDLHIIEIYGMIREVCEEEFNEDNSPTLNRFLRDLHEESLR